MKKILAIILSVVLLCGCTQKTPTQAEDESHSFVYGVWVTYAELSTAAQNGFEKSFTQLCQNAKSMGANALFVHLRAFCDSVYPSSLFPMCDWAEKENKDVLSLMLKICKENGLAFHGWINPYRVSSSTNDIEKLPQNSPVRAKPEMLGVTSTGLYLDPSNNLARRLVIDGIREIIDNYDVDGIHFDDYFYTTTDEIFDSKSYAAYKDTCSNPLPLNEWRTVNVNLLIASVYSAIKNSGKDICFSVSPAADIEKNKNQLYADIEQWCNAGYIDAVIPQLYFGFDYPIEKFSFEQLLLDWMNLTENCNVRLFIGLAPYKLDTDQAPDKEEWENGTDIVARQIRHIKNQAYVSGAVFFSYSYLFGNTENINIQKKEIEKAIKE